MKPKDIPRLRSRLIDWYKTHHRQLPWRDSDDPYHIWVSEVMLQQTQVKTVLPYYERFLRRFPDLKSLAQADLQEVLKLWEGLGYYARARNLHRAAAAVVENYAGKIPNDWKAFQKLPGVGEYIASAVQSIAFHQPYAVTDGNVKRVLARLYQIDAPVNQSRSHKIFRDTANDLLEPDQAGIFNQAMMELGATVCKPGKPACERCPVQPFCSAYQHQTAADYPKRIQNKPVPEYHLAVGVIYKKNQVLITRRKDDGLLGGLWEFPGGKIEPGEDARHACIRNIREQINLSVEIEADITRVKHAYTHFKIIADVFRCRVISGKVKLTGPADYRWIKPDETDQYPFSKANLKFIPLIRS